MIAIGNGEPCPYCGKIMKENKIDKKPVLEHLFDKHKDETLTQLFHKTKEKNNG